MLHSTPLVSLSSIFWALKINFSLIYNEKCWEFQNQSYRWECIRGDFLIASCESAYTSQSIPFFNQTKRSAQTHAHLVPSISILTFCGRNDAHSNNLNYTLRRAHRAAGALKAYFLHGTRTLDGRFVDVFSCVYVKYIIVVVADSWWERGRASSVKIVSTPAGTCWHIVVIARDKSRQIEPRVWIRLVIYFKTHTLDAVVCGACGSSRSLFGTMLGWVRQTPGAWSRGRLPLQPLDMCWPISKTTIFL